MTSNASRLLDAATEVFAERGYDGAGVAEIARRAGLTTGAIYSRYAGKADLLVDALDAQMAESLASLLAASESDGPVDTLSMLGSHLLDDAGRQDALFLEAVVAARREPELADMLSRKLEDERSRVSKLIEQAKTDGAFDPMLDTQAVLTFIQSIGLGFTVLRTLQTPKPGHDDWSQVIERVLAAARPAPSTMGENP